MGIFTVIWAFSRPYGHFHGPWGAFHGHLVFSRSFASMSNVQGGHDQTDVQAGGLCRFECPAGRFKKPVKVSRRFQQGTWSNSNACLCTLSSERGKKRFSGPLDRSFPWPRAVHETNEGSNGHLGPVRRAAKAQSAGTAYISHWSLFFGFCCSSTICAHGA